MLVNLVGKNRVDYVSKKTGNAVKGFNFYYTKQNVNRNGEGLVTGEFYLSDSRLQSLNVALVVGKSYDVYFNEYKQIEMLVPVNK